MLTLRLRGTYELHLDPANENAGRPSLDVWLTQSVSRDFHRVELTPPNPLGPTAGPLDVELQFALLPGVAEKAVLASVGYARLMLDAYAMMSNRHGEVCRNQAGRGRLALCELFGPDARTDAALRVPVVFPMLAPSEDGARKGTIVLKTADCSLTWRGKRARDVVPAWVMPQLDLSPLEDYIQAMERAFGPGGMRSRWGFFDNVNLFRYVCSVGILPAAAYINSPIGIPCESFYLNVARLALRMIGLTEEHALTRWNLDANTTDCRFAAYWLATMVSLYVQSCDYISDEVCMHTREGFRRTPVEWFYQARVRNGAIDCEDAALETMIQALELVALATRHPLLLLAQRVKRAFYAVLLLTGVSSAEINLSEKAAPNHLDAHMNSALVSKAQLDAWAGGLCAKHGPSPADIAESRRYPPIVMMEGTGPLDANGIEHATADDAAELALERMMGAGGPLLGERLRRIFHYDASGKHQSGFYKAVKVLSTGELAAHGCGKSLWMLSKATDPAGARLAGVEFQEMAAASPSIVALHEKELTAAQLAVMHAYMLDLHPQPALRGPSDGDAVDPLVARARGEVERLRAAMAPMIRAETGARVHEAIRVAKYAHFDAHGDFANQLIAAASHSGLRLVGFEAVEYAVTPDRGFYHLVYRMEL